MPKRPVHKLRALYTFRKARPKSAADGPGVLYAFVDQRGTLWKVGHTNNFPRRRAEWDKQCPCPDRVWLPPIPVPQRRRAESLVHLLLEIVCQDRPRTYCAQCAKIHTEKFTFIGSFFTVWNMIIKYVLKRVATA
ncbi:hypothetical protein F5879DRAFT_531155 [Lentinula edodes]|nr:hypothetical protein F5879DRAFT_531155 [Lentinula edodes]